MAPDSTARQRHLPELSLMNNNGPRDFGHGRHGDGMRPTFRHEVSRVRCVGARVMSGVIPPASRVAIPENSLAHCFHSPAGCVAAPALKDLF